MVRFSYIYAQINFQLKIRKLLLGNMWESADSSLQSYGYEKLHLVQYKVISLLLYELCG